MQAQIKGLIVCPDFSSFPKAYGRPLKLLKCSDNSTDPKKFKTKQDLKKLHNKSLIVVVMVVFVLVVFIVVFFAVVIFVFVVLVFVLALTLIFSYTVFN